MNCTKRLQRFFSAVIVVTFFVTNTLTPFPTAQAAEVQLSTTVTIPAEFGRITEIVPQSGSNSLFIHIQEAHANFDAQQNIKNILRYLSEHYGIKLVLLEGAGNKLKPELFNFYPEEPELQNAINRTLLKSGDLTGAEVFMIENMKFGTRDSGLEKTRNQNKSRGTSYESRDAKAEAYGVENPEAYAKDREAFRKVYGGRDIADKFLGKFYLDWQKQASRQLNKALREFLAQYVGFEEERLPLSDWLETLRASAHESLKLDLKDAAAQNEWPVLVRYFRLKEIGGKIDEKKAEEEKQKFLSDIAQYDEKNLTGEIKAMFDSAKKHDLPVYKTRFVFERLMDILPKDFSWNAYPNLRLEIQQMILLSELQSDPLQGEIKGLAKRLVEAMVQTEKEKQLTETLREYQLLRKLFHLELSREEYQALQQRHVSLENLGQKSQRAVQELYDSAFDFYRGAIEREDFMMKRAHEVMDERKQTRAVLITGGFHTNGVKEKVLASGSAYINITPNISEVTKEEQLHYFRTLLGQNLNEKSQFSSQDVPAPLIGKNKGVQESEIGFSLISDGAFIKTLPDGLRFLEMRLANIRGSVGAYLAERFKGDEAQTRTHTGRLDLGMQRIIQSVAGVPVSLVPSVTAVRSETREGLEQKIGQLATAQNGDWQAYLEVWPKLLEKFGQDFVQAVSSNDSRQVLEMIRTYREGVARRVDFSSLTWKNVVLLLLSFGAVLAGQWVVDANNSFSEFLVCIGAFGGMFTIAKMAWKWSVEEEAAAPEIRMIDQMENLLMRADPAAFRPSISEGKARSETRESEQKAPDVKAIKIWQEAFDAIQWIIAHEPIEQHLQLIRQLSLYLRNNKETIRLNVTRDYKQYPDDLAQEAGRAAIKLLAKTPRNLWRPVKELVLALPYDVPDNFFDLRSTLWGIGEELDERLLRTRFARDLRQILHGPSFSYAVLSRVQAYLKFLDTGDDSSLRQDWILPEDADRALQKRLSVLSPEEKAADLVYSQLKELEDGLSMLFGESADPKFFNKWLALDFVKQLPELSKALEAVRDSASLNAFERVNTLIKARRVVTEALENVTSPTRIYRLYHLDRSLGQMLSLAMGAFINEWDRGDWAFAQALTLTKALSYELLQSGFITRYTVQWADLLNDPELTFEQLRDVLNVMEREMRRELARWMADYHAAGVALYGNDLAQMERSLALLRKEKFSATVALQLLEIIKEKVDEKKPGEMHEAVNPAASAQVAQKREEDPFAGIVHIDDFRDPARVPPHHQRRVYGGKGTYLMSMSSLGLPVPSAFILPVEIGKSHFYQKKQEEFQKILQENLSQLETEWSEKTGKKAVFGQAPSALLGDDFEPLFLSVRSGAVFIMPGIFETAVAVGFTPTVLEHEIKARGPRAAYMAFLNFLESVGVSLGIPREEFEAVLRNFTAITGKKNPADLTLEDYRMLEKKMNGVMQQYGVYERFQELFSNPMAQLEFLVGKVFESWDGDRARRYRREKNISDEWGTPAIVQAYVFGDRDEKSGAGIALSRDRSTAEKRFNGEWMPSTEGMALMQGRLEPFSIEKLKLSDPTSASVIEESVMRLDEYYGVPQMVEFTVESGKPWLLQTVHDQRVGKKGVFSDPDWQAIGAVHPIGHGNVAFGDSGIVRGIIVTNKDDILRGDLISRLKNDPDLDAIAFVSHFPTSEDSPVVINAQRVLQHMGKTLLLLTARGGMTSHAAVVANYESIPTVVGISGLEVTSDRDVKFGNWTTEEGGMITVDLATGNIYQGNLARKQEVRSEAREQAIFTGVHSAELDNQKRLAIPAAFRKMLGKDAQMIAVPEKEIKGFRVYPLEAWQKAIAANRPQDVAEARKYDDNIHRNAFLLQWDGQGRVRLSEPVRAGFWDASIKRAEISGAGDSFIITPASQRSEARNVFDAAVTSGVLGVAAYRSEVRAVSPSSEESWAAKNVPDLEDYTIVSRQLEAGLSRDILDALEKKYGKEIAGLVAATTVTGGLGALMHDLFPSWQKNFGQPKKKDIDAFTVNVIYDEIKGQAYAKNLPEEVTSGKKTLGDYLREVLTENPDLRLSVFPEASNEFRAKAEEWIGRTGDPLYRKRLQQAREAVDREIKVKVYPTETSVGGMPNFYIEAFYVADDGTKVQIFDEVYPDAPHGGPNLWRDLQMGVYRKITELLTLKLQEQGVVKKKILFVDNEVFVSLPTPLLPDALHHHMNHSVFAPTIYQPEEVSLELLGYSKALRPYIARNGKISIVDAVGTSFDLVTGVALYEHTPAVAGGVMPGYVDSVDSYNQDGLRSTNGVLLEQWQSPLLRALIDSYKKKLGMDPAVDDRDFFAKLSEPSQQALLGEFKERTDLIKGYLTGRLMFWLKENQNSHAWFNQAMKAYQEEFMLPEVHGAQILADLHTRIQKALENEAEWPALLGDAKVQVLKREFLKKAIVSNVRRQVSYKGPDKWIEILRKLQADPGKLAWYKKNAARAVIGGREFGPDAHGLFLEIQRLVRELGLEDLFATIENYNIEVAPIIFQGVSGTVMLSYEALEASATSMMKGLPNGSILIGVWGGAEPELFTIVEPSTGREVNIFTEHVTYKELVENLHAGKWKITNGFLVEYSENGDGKFILDTLEAGKIKQLNARFPVADSLINDLVSLQEHYQVPAKRRDLEWEAIRSSPVVDMEKSQARAHMKLWQKAVQKNNKKNGLLEKSGLSPEQALRFLSRNPANDTGFVWRNDASYPLEIAPPGLLGFLESARRIRTHAGEGYRSVAYHAARGDIFAKIFSYFDGLDKEAPVFYQEMARLRADAAAATDPLEKVRIHLAALRLLDRFTVQLAGSILQGAVGPQNKEYEKLFRNELFRKNLYFYLESQGQQFGSLNKSLVGFSVPVGNEKYIVALNLGEPKYPGVDGGEPKAWGQLYGQQVFEDLTGQTDPESALTFQVVDAMTGEVYGTGEDRKPYPFWMLAQGALPIGVPSSDVQILKLRATGGTSQGEKKEQSGSLILDDLRALVSGNPADQVRQQKPRSYWLKQAIVYLQRSKPGELKTRLQTVSGIGRDKAISLFGAEGVRPVMAFIATLAPELLEEMKDWDPEVYAALKNLIQDPEMKDLFEKGEVFFNNVSRDTAIVLSRVLKEEKDGQENTRHVVVAIHFSKFPYNKEEGKVWFGTGSISVLGLAPNLVYQTRDQILKVDYDKKHTVASLHKDGWRMGVSVVRRKDPAGIQQPGWRFQVLQMVPVGINPAEPSIQKSRSESRDVEQGKIGIDGQELANALKAAGQSVAFIDRSMSVEHMADRIAENQVIYLSPLIDETYDYGKYEEQLIHMAMAKIGPALEMVRRGEASSHKPRQRKVFILRGMVDPGTSKSIYDAIKWNAHPPQNDDFDFDLVFQPDFSFLDVRTEKSKEPVVVFGLMKEDDGKDAAFQAATLAILDRVFGQFYKDQKIQYMRIRSAEMAKEMLLIYLGAKLAHFDDVAELSRAYGADLSAAAFGAGLDKRIRTLFTNPSLGFGGRLFVYLHWIYAQRLYKAAVELEGQTHQTLNDRKKEIEQKVLSAVNRLEHGENITDIVKELPPQLHLLFVLKTILKINKQNILDFYKSIERTYESMYGNGALHGKKVALLSVGYSAQSGQITASPALLLIERLIIDQGISEFTIAEPGAHAAFSKWVEAKQKENPRFNAVKFEFTDSVYDAVGNADLAIIPTDSNKALKEIDIHKLGVALRGRPVFDGMNLFGLRADGTYQYKLEDVRNAGINLLGVGRLPLGPGLDNQTGYRLGDSTVIRDIAGYKKALEERNGSLTVQQKTVAVIGGGYVGLVTAANLAALGHRVHVVDIKAKQKEIDALNSAETAVPIYEPGLREMIIDGKAKGLITFSTDLEPAVKDSSIVYLAVGTPSQDTGEVDLKYILKASEDVGDVIKKYGGSKAIVIKSTVTPDTFVRMNEVLTAKGLSLGKNYVPVSNPEFLREGQAIEDVTKPDRTVLGFYAALSPEDRKRAEKEILELWYPLMLKKEHTVLLTDTASSTIVKYMANSFLAISITLSNLFSAAAEGDYADFMEVRMPFKADDRIGGNAFLDAGVGYGGSCFPKDVLALNFSSKNATGHVLPLIDIATGFNDHFKTAVVARTIETVAQFPHAARPLEGKSVIMLGMAFKADTDDMREASSAYVLHELLAKGAAQVRLHDPILSMPNVPAPEVVVDHFLDYLYKTFRQDEEFQAAYKRHNALLSAQNEPIVKEPEYFKKIYFQEKFVKTGRVAFEPDLSKLGQADMVFLVTEWREYKGIDLSTFKQANRKLWVIDGRNLFYNRRDEISKFADYRGIGTTNFSPRSENRNEIVEKPSAARSEVRNAAVTSEMPVLGFNDFIERNIKMGGGSQEAMRQLTVEIMNGIAPLLANDLNVIEAVVRAIFSSEKASEMLKVVDSKRIAAARALLGVKTVQSGDAFILGREFALGHGFLAAVRIILGDAPVAVIVQDEKDRAFVEKFNQGLAPEKRILITSDTGLSGAKSALRKQIKTDRMDLKALLYGSETLREQLSDITVQRITPRMFKNFLRLAGDQINAIVQEVQAQFSLARSA